jgi:flagellar biosynthesis GTPase FlhF
MFCLAVLASRASAGPDAGIDTPAPVAPPVDAEGDASVANQRRAYLAVLTAHRDALQTLLAGKLPDDLYTTELFAIDLHDEATVERRRDELAAQLDGGMLEPRPAADAGIDTTPMIGDAAAARDAAVPRDAAAGPVHRDAGAGPGDDAVRTTSPVPASDAGVVAPSPADDADVEREIAVRQVEVDRLRLAFLQLPLDRRNAVLQAEEVARRNALERAAAADELARSEAEQRRAEAAQRAALDQAQRSREATQRLLANEQARIEGARASLAEQRAQLSRLRARRSTDATEAHRLAFSMIEQARDVASGSQADALYDRVVAEVEAARTGLSGSLDRLDALPAPVRFELSSAIQASRDPSLVAARVGLEQGAAEVDALGKQLAADRGAMEWQLANDEANDAEDLNNVRIQLLDRLSSDKRDRTLGFGEEGRDQLARELAHLTLLARWTWRSKLPELARAVDSLRSVNSLIWFLVRIIGVAIVIALGRWSIVSGRRHLRELPPTIVRAVPRPVLARLVLAIVSLLEAIWRPLLIVIAIWAIGVVAAPVLASPIAAVPFGLVMALVVYRLVVVVLYHAIRQLQGSGTIWSPQLGDRVLRSVYFVGRVAFAFYVLSQLSSAILGRGYLYHLVIRFTALAALPLALVLFRRWRGDIVDAYLRRRPTGWLAGLVKRSRDRWYGFFLAIAAFALVLLQWTVSGVRRFALSFDQTRKALAYLFRRRLERRSTSEEPNPPPELPDAVRAALESTTSQQREMLVPRFPRLDEFRADVAAWKRSQRHVGSWAVIGKSGMGKTTWLHAAAIASELPTLCVELPGRIVEVDDLLPYLGRALGLEAPGETEVIDALRTGPQRLIVVDDLQRLALRGVGQLAVWRRLCRIIEATYDRVYWLGGCSFYADEYLSWVRHGPSVFREVTRLAPWSEPQIQALLSARIAATGWEVSYDDLISIQVEPSQRAMAIANTAREYARLIWDYAEGSPRAALDCWAKSLVPDGRGRLRVRLFARPPDGQLEALDDVSRLVLAALIWHEQLALDHTVTVLRFSRSQCELALRRLDGAGIIRSTPSGDYVVATAWWPAVTRYLTRKHLIES